MKEKPKILNNDIRASLVQVITDEGENLGEMSLSDAKTKAKELNLDLMEIGRSGNVAILKMLDYGKFIYKQKKQEQKSKLKGKAPDLKTIRITFKIGEHDVEIRKKQAQKFGLDGHPLKVTLMLKGRENQYLDIAFEKINSFVKSLEDVYKLDGEIKKAGNIFLATLKPKK